MNRILALLLICVSPGIYRANAAGNERPSIGDVAFVRFSVANWTDTTFYSHTLRLSPATTCLAENEKCFAVNATQRVELIKVPSDKPTNQVEAIGFYTSNVGDLREYLLAHGLKPGEIRNSHGQAYFEILDPENHLLVFMARSSSATDFRAPAVPFTFNLIHAGFVVRDQQAMDKFYRDVLGFHAYWHGGMKDGDTDWVDMQVPNGADWIEYMLNVPADADKRTLGVMNHVALGVRSVKTAAQQLQKDGVKLPEDPQIGRDGKWQLNLYDSNDTRVELMEYTPVQKPCCSAYTGAHPKP
jgi:catechol 2,3-dioxygenase-like lactoylglutathione lyase family enzyme